MTLFCDESTILEEVSIDYENKVTIYDDYCDDMYAIKSSDDYIKTCHDYDYPFSEHYSFNVETILVFESLMILPLFRMGSISVMCRAVNCLCLLVMKIML